MRVFMDWNELMLLWARGLSFYRSCGAIGACGYVVAQLHMDDEVFNRKKSGVCTTKGTCWVHRGRGDIGRGYEDATKKCLVMQGGVMLGAFLMVSAC